MSNPLNDPRAAAMMAAVPDDVTLLYTGFDAAAAEAQTASRGLRAAQADQQWQGKAADQFRASIGTFPNQLGRVCNGYWEVANALRAYEATLRECQQRFATAQHLISDAQTTFSSLNTTAQTANQTYAADLKPGCTKTFKQKEADYRAASVASGKASDAERTLNGYYTGGNQILDEFSTAVKTAIARIEVASQYAISPPKPRGPAPDPGNHVHGGGNGNGNGNGGRGHGGPNGGGGGGNGGGNDSHAPKSVRAKVTAMTDKAKSLLGTPYVYGGGHGSSWGPSGGGLDCSSFVSNVLHAGGYLNAPQTTDTLPGQPGILNGAGKYVTIYDRPDDGDNSHVIIDINGHFYEEGGGAESGGQQDVHEFTPSAAYLHSFTRLMHPAGL